ncbi:hypothetical protein [Kitasatospora sp. CB01950]|uniref:hypothetical protein n=1 Tax=Kitasatospora sp. CB01950 TaxID=1703930 RepID=UPI00093B7579|nr:hypothetical protein [Kitasatospora sp. CB01950]OKJ06811.1 hypothetical protein AMK19_23440 [Kitasatospora sp. CB01950]
MTAPEPDLRQRIAQAINGGLCATRSVLTADIAAELAEAVLAELDALREQHRRALLAATESSSILQQQIDAQAGDLDARDAENTRLRAELSVETAARLGLRNRLDRVIASNAQLRAALDTDT